MSLEGDMQETEERWPVQEPPDQDGNKKSGEGETHLSPARVIFNTYEVKTHLVMAVQWQGPAIKDAVTENELKGLDVPFERSRNWGRIDQGDPWELIIKNPRGDSPCPRGHYVIRKAEDDWISLSEGEFNNTYDFIPDPEQ